MGLDSTVNSSDTEGRSLPGHLVISPGTRAISMAAIGCAFTLLSLLAIRILWESPSIPWYGWVALPAGMLLADFLSGMIHWSADTWGSESMPILGQRLLHPFRVHHLNPADFLQRRFSDTNGDVALLAVPILLAAQTIPLTNPWTIAAAMFVVSFAAIGLMTNQIHQWAHMPRPPRPVQWLQNGGLILDHAAHEQHHRPPYVQNYCIATGWCNRPLARLGFFPRLERAITRLTGISPRNDDANFHSTYGRDTGERVESTNERETSP